MRVTPRGFVSGIHHRRSIRLAGHDYSLGGAYFLTPCTYRRLPILGSIHNGTFFPSALGEAAAQCWLAIPRHGDRAMLDAFVVMPDHMHGIIWLAGRKASLLRPAARQRKMPPSPRQSCLFRSPSDAVGSIVRGFKIGVVAWAKANLRMDRVWQRNYYDSIIRDERSLERIRSYIVNNPAHWLDDRFHQARQAQP